MEKLDDGDMVALPVFIITLSVLLLLTDTLYENEAEGLLEVVALGDTPAEGEADCETDHEEDEDTDKDTEGDMEGDMEEDIDRDMDGDGLVETLTEAEADAGDPEGDMDGDGIGDIDEDEEAEGLTDADIVFDADCVLLGLMVSDREDEREGIVKLRGGLEPAEGEAEGIIEIVCEGEEDFVIA